MTKLCGRHFSFQVNILHSTKVQIGHLEILIKLRHVQKIHLFQTCVFYFRSDLSKYGFDQSIFRVPIARQRRLPSFCKVARNMPFISPKDGKHMENLCFSAQVKLVKLHNLPFSVMLRDEFKCDFHYFENGP